MSCPLKVSPIFEGVPGGPSYGPLTGVEERSRAGIRRWRISHHAPRDRLASPRHGGPLTVNWTTNSTCSVQPERPIFLSLALLPVTPRLAGTPYYEPCHRNLWGHTHLSLNHKQRSSYENRESPHTLVIVRFPLVPLFLASRMGVDCTYQIRIFP